MSRRSGFHIAAQRVKPLDNALTTVPGDEHITRNRSAANHSAAFANINNIFCADKIRLDFVGVIVDNELTVKVVIDAICYHNTVADVQTLCDSAGRTGHNNAVTA